MDADQREPRKSACAEFVNYKKKKSDETKIGNYIYIYGTGVTVALQLTRAGCQAAETSSAPMRALAMAMGDDKDCAPDRLAQRCMQERREEEVDRTVTVSMWEAAVALAVQVLAAVKSREGAARSAKSRRENLWSTLADSKRKSRQR